MKPFLTFVGALFASIATAHAFVSNLVDSGQPQRWDFANKTLPVSTNVFNPATKAIRYFLSADAYSTTHRDAELNAVRACFDQWQAVPGSILRFEEGGLMNGNLDVNTADNTNVVFWAKKSTLVNGGLDDISGSTGVTFVDYFSDGTLAEADIVLNAVEYTWFTDFSDTANRGFLVEAVALHEIGHLLGLAHSPVGAATMFPRGGQGVSVQAGLSSDEISAIHTLYPQASIPPTLARLTGQVTLGGKGVFGAIVIAENAAGNVAAGTISTSAGAFDLPGLPPGNYQIHAAPVDMANTPFYLFRGSDVSRAFATAQTNFAASASAPVTLVAGRANTLTIPVSGTPTHLARIRPPTTNPDLITIANYPVQLPTDGTEVWVGVYSSEPVNSDAVVRVTGDGLTQGPTTFKANAFPGLNPPLNLFTVAVQVGADATPGMRSLVLQSSTGLAYAHGFYEVPTPFPDYNFDGLDDRFQRQFFPRWTAPDAAPTADPDGDGFTNYGEYLAGTSPVDGQSVLRITGISVEAGGLTLRWQSPAGKRFQVFSRPRVDSLRGWQPIGTPVVAGGPTAEFHDAVPTITVQFYRIQAVP